MKIFSRWDSSKILFEDESEELIRCLEHAVREKANLYKANLTGANLTGAASMEIPNVPHLDQVVLEMVENEKIIFNMHKWREVTPCGTTCCRAGAAVLAAGEKGIALEDKFGGVGVGTQLAALLIYRESCPTLPDPNFFCDNDTALADMRQRVTEGC